MHFSMCYVATIIDVELSALECLFIFIFVTGDRAVMITRLSIGS